MVSTKNLPCVGLTLLFGFAATCAQATMPLLTEQPKPPSLTACQRWAAKQDEDAMDMWGTQESGKSSIKVAIGRLADYCMGKERPEIVGFGSSIGAATSFCEKHRSAPICKGR